MVNKPLVNQYGAAIARSTVLYSSDTTGGYDVVKDKGRRKNPRTGKSKEHVTYNQRNRDKAQGTGYDIVRNDIVAQWAFNKFLDYTTVHYFQSSTGDQGLDEELEFAVDDWSMAENCDISRRHSLDSIIRLHASGKALDGDSAIILTDSWRLQGIEGDNIRTPDWKVDILKNNLTKEITGAVQGLILDDFGAVQYYVICRKSEMPGRYEYVATVPASSVIFDGNFFRFDQVRGIPVLNAAANTSTDIKEIDEYQLIKVKMHAMHALAFKSDASQTGYNEAPLANGVAGQQGTTATTGPAYEFEMDSGMKIELNPGDSVDMLESKTPSREYKEFSEVMMRKFLLAWGGMPFEYFNPGNASYSVMKHIRAEFKFGIMRFEKKSRETRYSILKWVFPYLLKKYGIALPDKFKDGKIFRFLNWLPQAEPWLEEDREVSAALARIDGGLSNHEIESARRGNDAYDIFRGAKRAQSYIRTSKLVIATGQPGAMLWNQSVMNNQNVTVTAGSQPADSPPADSSASGGDSLNDNNGDKE